VAVPVLLVDSVSVSTKVNVAVTAIQHNPPICGATTTTVHIANRQPTVVSRIVMVLVLSRASVPHIVLVVVISNVQLDAIPHARLIPTALLIPKVA